MSSVDGAAPGTRRGTWWTATVQWRNWPLLVKLGVVLVVPVVSALVLGVLRVHADVELAESYAAIERVADLRAQLVSVATTVEDERDQAVRQGGQIDQAVRATDDAVAAMHEVVRRNPELGEVTTGYRAVVRALESLPAARRQVTSGVGGMVVLSAYNAVVDTVLEFDRTLVGQFPDQNLTGTSIAVSELQGMRDQIALQHAIGNLALRDRALPDSARQLLVEADVRFDDKLDDFRSQAPSALATSYDAGARGLDVAEYQQMVDAVRTVDPTSLQFSQEEWDAASNATSTLMTDLTRRAASDLRADSDALAESISNRAGLESVLLLTMVLLAAGVGGVLGQYLLRSVGVLRRTALDVAHARLPAAVESIRSGEGAQVTIEPVPLSSTEEFGQLARAFDAVHGQAVRSAAEEAGLRSNLANIFTNLSRRSQGLVERQLRLMEQLEQKTDDPEQLENLFKIDHLATRMRRNNENLMVLSGTGLLRRFTEPMPLPDVLRAAISEVEHYQRAVVRSVPDVRIAGYAAGDLIRSVSELIENATAFSPPNAEVAVESRLLGDGSSVIDIIDDGVGMGEADLRAANQRIAGGGGVDVPISRQMGLFVVGRLTARHGIHVRLASRSEGGLCASVLVPAGLVNIGDPGQTASIELPNAAPGEPATAVEWLRSAGMPAVPGGLDPVTGRPEAAGLPKRVGRTGVPAAAAGRSAESGNRLFAPGSAPAMAAIPGPETSLPGIPAVDASTAGASEPSLPGPRGSGASPAQDRAGDAETPVRGAPAPGTPPTDLPALDGVPESFPAIPAIDSSTVNQPPAGSAEPSATAATAASAASDISSAFGSTSDSAATAVFPSVSARLAASHHWPSEEFEPVEVAGRLESAGIVVSLPDLPGASTPADILFAETEQQDFTWLRRSAASTETTGAPAAPSPPAAPAVGPAGLPKRVPKGQLVAPARGQAQQPPAARNAVRARGFLAGFQAGVRQSENREGEQGS